VSAWGAEAEEEEEEEEEEAEEEGEEEFSVQLMLLAALCAHRVLPWCSLRTSNHPLSSSFLQQQQQKKKKKMMMMIAPQELGQQVCCFRTSHSWSGWDHLRRCTKNNSISRPMTSTSESSRSFRFLDEALWG
jgi:hypothetical protein